MKTDAEILRDAASLIAARGLAKGTYEKRGCICTAHAMRLASGNVDRHPMDLPVYHRFARYVGAPRGLISMWNDSAERTTASVVRSLVDCAFEIENGGAK